MTDMSFDFGDIRITVPKKYIPLITDLAWFWGHTDLAEKIETTTSDIIDINHEELIQLTEILYNIIR